MADIITPITQALGGGAALTAIGYIVYALWKLWTQREERRSARAQASAQSIDQGFSRLILAAERQDAEIARLSERSVEDRGRIEALEASNRELIEENRTFHTLISALIEGLRRKPPDSAETLLKLIFAKVPNLGNSHSKD